MVCRNQASLSITNSQSLLKLMSIESVTFSHSAFKPSRERAVWPSVQPELCGCRAPHKASSTGGKPLTWEHTHTLTQSPEAMSHFQVIGKASTAKVPGWTSVTAALVSA